MRVRAYIGPGLLIGGMLSISCTVPFVSYTASIVNGTDRPVDVRLRITERGGSLETTTVTLPPGGSVQRLVAGDPSRIFADAWLVKGGLVEAFAPANPTMVATEMADGVKLVPKPEERKENPK